MNKWPIMAFLFLSTLNRISYLLLLASLLLLGSCSPEFETSNYTSTSPRLDIQSKQTINIGRSHREWSDPARVNWNDGAESARPLRTTIWYPARDQNASGRSISPKTWKPQSIFGFSLFDNGSNALDAPLRPAVGGSGLPLIVLSHGTGGAASNFSWLATKLVKHGYIVAAVDHHGNNTARGMAILPHGLLLWWERARDLQLLIDNMLKDNIFGPHIDPKRIGVGGFSLGGFSALQMGGANVDLDEFNQYCEQHPDYCELPQDLPMSLNASEIVQFMSENPHALVSIERASNTYFDRRVKAIYSMAPAITRGLSRRSLETVKIPTRIIVGINDLLAHHVDNGARVSKLIPGASLRLLEGIPHFAFLPECKTLGRWILKDFCEMPEGRSRSNVHETVATDALTFFDQQLKN